VRCRIVASQLVTAGPSRRTAIYVGTIKFTHIVYTFVVIGAIEIIKAFSGTMAFTVYTFEAIGAVGIEQPQKTIKQYPHQLSGGMLQRVMLAVALSCRPELLIADEPTSSLDVTTERAILDLLCALKKTENISILLITHNLAIVAGRSDYIAVMQKGRLIEQGDTKQIIKNPSQPYTKSLLADAARNKL